MSDILINGKVYSGVDTINVQKQDGGTAKYTEGERPSGTIEITENGDYDVTNYAKATVSIVGESGETKEIVVDLPTEYGTYTVYNIFTFQVNEDTILFCAGTSKKGIYRYSIKEKSLELLFDNANGGQYNMFQMVGENCLLMNSSSDGQGILLYNNSEKTITRILEIGHTWKYIILDGDICILGNTGSGDGLGVYSYDNTTKTVTKLYDKGALMNGKNIILKDYILMSSTSSGAGYLGVFVYDKRTNSGSFLYETGYSWNFMKIGDNCLISSTVSSVVGILFFNSETKTIDLIYEDSYCWIYSCIVDDNLLISSRIAEGILLFDNNTKTISKIYSTYKYWDTFILVGAGALISSTITSGSSNAQGVLLYDKETKTITTLSTTGRKYTTFIRVGNDLLVSSSYATGNIYLYDDSARTYTKIFSSGLTDFGYSFQIDENRWIISGNMTSSSSYGVALYNATTKTAKGLFYGGQMINDGVSDELGNYYVYNNITRKKIFYFDKEKNNLKLVKYNLGEI